MRAKRFLINALAWAVPLALLLLATPAAAAPLPCYQALVIDIHDGDTITVLPADKRKPEVIRVNALDTPELEVRDRRGNLRWPDQPWGHQAQEALWAMAWGEEVKICPKFKSYGRTGATVLLNGVDLAEPMAALGLAWVGCRATCPRVRAAADEARTARRGLWADPTPCKPAKWRKGGCK